MTDQELPIGTLEQILSAKDTNEDFVNVPEWGCKVKVKGLTKADQVRLRKQSTRAGKVDESKLEGLVLVNGMVEPKITPDRVDALFEKSSGAVDRVLLRIFELSGMTDNQGEEAEADFRD